MGEREVGTLPVLVEPRASPRTPTTRSRARHAIVTRIEPPIGLRELRGDPVTAGWPALRSGFVQSAMAMPETIWDRLVELAVATPARRPPRRPRRKVRSPFEREQIERQLEEWLADHLEALETHGFRLELVGRQRYCSGHGGRSTCSADGAPTAATMPSSSSRCTKPAVTRRLRSSDTSDGYESNDRSWPRTVC
jgi:hypothetical protein